MSDNFIPTYYTDEASNSNINIYTLGSEYSENLSAINNLTFEKDIKETIAGSLADSGTDTFINAELKEQLWKSFFTNNCKVSSGEWDLSKSYYTKMFNDYVEKFYNEFLEVAYEATKVDTNQVIALKITKDPETEKILSDLSMVCPNYISLISDDGKTDSAFHSILKNAVSYVKDKFSISNENDRESLLKYALKAWFLGAESIATELDGSPLYLGINFNVNSAYYESDAFYQACLDGTSGTTSKITSDTNIAILLWEKFLDSSDVYEKSENAINWFFNKLLSELSVVAEITKTQTGLMKKYNYGAQAATDAINSKSFLTGGGSSFDENGDEISIKNNKTRIEISTLQAKRENIENLSDISSGKVSQSNSNIQSISTLLSSIASTVYSVMRKIVNK